MANTSEASQQANRSGMDPLRLVVIFYLISAIVLALFFSHVFTLLWARFALPNREILSGTNADVPTVLGIVLSLAFVVFCYANTRVRGKALESATELMKVTWPTWPETRLSTIAVIIASLVSALILFGIDTLAYQVMVNWIPALWGKL
ncbi:MAG: preprotein translocase subunit SecE [Myxococcaceae bacterium]|nr:preprotein translocase subunit SecE [Myxococcaceae bacterium]